jgi:nitroimidazol reductase NimA-like FMN-containing flavoprotein (pyridoxamine 5'-phosphate oxidase superfamily)/DNA-binding XRE family transcriptional regulator
MNGMTATPQSAPPSDPVGETGSGSHTASANLPGPSDLARRVIHRRNELGLTSDELAKRVGVDPNYFNYFERNADARLSAGTLNLIALALGTTPITLAGGNVDRAPGRGRAGRHPSLDALEREHCDAHLAAGGVGRIVFSTDRGPVALPVNFEFTEGEIVFSTDQAKADMLAKLPLIGFEIDRVDEGFSEGWSVLVSGPARRVVDPDELQRLSSLDLEAWAGGDRHAVVKLAPLTVTGRVIVHNPPADED